VAFLQSSDAQARREADFVCPVSYRRIARDIILPIPLTDPPYSVHHSAEQRF